MKEILTPRQKVLKQARVERLKQEKIDSQKQAQVLPSTEERIKSAILARKAFEAQVKATPAKIPGIITKQVSIKILENHKYKITNKAILQILNATIKEGKNLLGEDSIKLGAKIDVNENSVRIISEHAYRLINPEFTSVLNTESASRYIQVMGKALKLAA